MTRDAARRAGVHHPGVRGLEPAWAEKAQRHVLAGDLELLQRARLTHPSVRWWWGARLVGFTFGAWCYLCERHVATWDRKYPMTDQAAEAVLEHRDQVHSLATSTPGSVTSPTLGGADHTKEAQP